MPKSKPKAKASKLKARSKRRSSGKAPEDVVIQSGRTEPKSIKLPSGVFEGGIDLSKIRSAPATSGVERFKLTNRILPTANLNSGFALPMLGAPTFFDDSRISEIRRKDPQGIRAAQANLTLQQPFFHTPGNAQDAFNLPKSYIEQIRWSRLMYNLNAWLGALIDLKAFYALSRFQPSTPEPFVTEFMLSESYNKNFNIYDFILRVSLSKQKFGEAPTWGARQVKGTWDKTGKPIIGWSHFILLEPELIEIKRDFFGSPKPRIYLRPSKDLEDLVKRMDQGDPEVAAYSARIPEQFKERIRHRELVPLDPSTSAIIQNLTDASATRGTPPLQRVMNTFVFEDFIRLGQMARAQRYHFPFEMWSVGSLEHKIKPTQADIDLFEDKVNAAIQNFPSNIFVPPIIKYEALGAGQVAMSPAEDYAFIFKQYTVGLGVSEQILLGESSIFSSTETSSNQAFIRARKKERDELDEWLRWNFYEPLSRWNNLKIKKGGALVPITPDIEWEKVLDYEAETRDIENRLKLYDKGVYPTARLLRKLTRENPEEIRMELQQELDTIFDNGKRIGGAALRLKLKQGQPLDKESGGTESQAGEAESPIPEKELGAGGKGGAGGGPTPAPEATPEALAAPEAGTPEVSPASETSKLL